MAAAAHQGAVLKEIVQKIIETEKEVRGRIDETKAQAQKIVRDAETRSREIVDEGRQRAVQEGQELVERLKKEAEEERSQRVSQVSGGSGELIERKGGELEKAVEKIAKLVTGAASQ